MRIVWSNEALVDLDRLHAFIAQVNPRAADKVIETLVSAPLRLLEYPRLGVRHEVLAPDEVRRLMVGNYEVRYQLFEDDISILRIFHGKEDRQ